MSDPPEPPVAAVVAERLRALAQQVRAADLVVRDEGPEGVHDLRVAMRRARSLLATFRPLLASDTAEDADRLRTELRWAAGELSAVRDLEVIHDRLFVEPVTGPGSESALARLEAHRDAQTLDARRQVEALLGSVRYAGVLADLEAFAWRADWRDSPSRTGWELVRKEWRRLCRRADAADEAAGDDREAALHEARKAGKRARYAAETLVPVYGEAAVLLAGRAELVQEALGYHRDTLLTRALLQRLAAEAAEAGEAEAAAVLLSLHAREVVRGDESLAAYEAVRARL